MRVFYYKVNKKRKVVNTRIWYDNFKRLVLEVINLILFQ